MKGEIRIRVFVHVRFDAVLAKRDEQLAWRRDIARARALDDEARCETLGN